MTDETPEFPQEIIDEVQRIFDRALADGFDPVWDEDGLGFTMDCPQHADDPERAHRVPVRPVMLSIPITELRRSLNSNDTAGGPAG